MKMFKILIALSILSISYKSYSLYDHHPIVFGYDLSREKVRNLTIKSVDIKLCSIKKCEWVTFSTPDESAWYINQTKVSFDDFKEKFLLSQQSDTHLFVINKESKQLLKAQTNDKYNLSELPQ